MKISVEMRGDRPSRTFYRIKEQSRFSHLAFLKAIASCTINFFPAIASATTSAETSSRSDYFLILSRDRAILSSAENWLGLSRNFV